MHWDIRCHNGELWDSKRNWRWNRYLRFICRHANIVAAAKGFFRPSSLFHFKQNTCSKNTLAAPQESNISVFKGNPISEEETEGEEKEALSPPESLRSWHWAAFFPLLAVHNAKWFRCTRGDVFIIPFSLEWFQIQVDSRKMEEQDREGAPLSAVLAQHDNVACKCNETAGARWTGQNSSSKLASVQLFAPFSERLNHLEWSCNLLFCGCFCFVFEIKLLNC